LITKKLSRAIWIIAGVVYTKKLFEICAFHCQLVIPVLCPIQSQLNKEVEMSVEFVNQAEPEPFPNLENIFLTKG
jgi:hypothetical protein